MKLNSSIQYIKGIGPKKKKLFNNLGIKNIYDLLYYFPRNYEDNSNKKYLNEIKDKEDIVIKAKITRIELKKIKSNLSIVKLTIKDEKENIGNCSFFNQNYIKKLFKENEDVYIFGKAKLFMNKIDIQGKKIEKAFKYENEENLAINPVYPLTFGLKNEDIKTALKHVFESNTYIEDYISEDLRKTYKLCDLDYALRNIHFPKDKNSLKIAMYRIAFDEFFILQLGLFYLKEENIEKESNLIFETKRTKEFINNLPFKLTKAQNNVLKEVYEDFGSKKPMNRLIQGDVGSGKTIVAIVALLECAFNNYQGAFMAPTEILAMQHYEYLKEIATIYNMEVAILKGNMKKKEKEDVLLKLKSGEISIVVGTHALFNDDVEFKNLSLVVTDEQHRFGVNQRKKLNLKGDFTNVLVMSATPIPRTLALMVYGDLDVSIIDELPPGRKKIETIAIKKVKNDLAYKKALEEIKKGRQVYIVCPLIDDNEENELTSVYQLYEDLKSKYFKYEKIEILHGKLKNKEKDFIMNEFKDNKIKILIATTVIEVGINVPNASIMIIENSERFGLAQLHQLRGRVGRGSYESFCILIYDSNNEVTKKRMDVMQQTNDGFIIAKKDLELRGPGQFFGLKQHGVPELKVGNIFKHIKILNKAQNEAKKIIKEDSNLKINEALKIEIKRRFDLDKENMIIS